MIDELQRKNKMTIFSSAEFSHLSQLMQEHHALFYEMWNLGKPLFDESIPTACITFNQEGDEIEYRINPQFWETLNDNQKCFVIGHESLHGILNHGYRANVKVDRTANVAMDLVVNHLLCNGFGFDRKEVDPKNKYCWIDLVLKDSLETVKENESFEYYYRLVSKYGKKDQELVDFHEKMEDASKYLKKLGEQLPEDVKEGIKDLVQKHMPRKGNGKKDGQGRGDTAGGMEYLVPNRKVKKKKKWETVIKKWARKMLAIKEKDLFQWARLNRRFALISSELSIPSEMEMEDHFSDDRKILVWFFSDTSGSCTAFRDRFFAAAESLDKKRFEVKMHCFDTQVYETTLESRKIYGGGGTSFDIIEDYIQKYCHDKGVKYPAAVFVVTDGDGNVVKPERPKNWYWFLSAPQHSCIPESSHKYLLADYE